MPLDIAADTATIATPLVSMLLYLCSDAPEVADYRKGLAWPRPPERKRGKGAGKIISAPGATYWSVGENLAEQIRSAHRDNAGSAKRVHIRRAHWHSYWVGEGRKTLRLNWLWPMVVGGKTEAEG
jgi:hypothetical protein